MEARRGKPGPLIARQAHVQFRSWHDLSPQIHHPLLGCILLALASSISFASSRDWVVSSHVSRSRRQPHAFELQAAHSSRPCLPDHHSSMPSPSITNVTE